MDKGQSGDLYVFFNKRAVVLVRLPPHERAALWAEYREADLANARALGADEAGSVALADAVEATVRSAMRRVEVRPE